jgi:drug/metabolite transporter (DMT)-like permease
MSLNYRRGVAALELFTAAMFWGFGFIASVFVLRETGAAHLAFLRFAISGLVVLPYALNPAGRASILKYLRPTFWPAMMLAGLIIMGNWGLQYTTATKSGFITTLYVVFVPLLEAYFNKRRVPQFLWLCVLISMAGTALIVNLGLDSLNRGDAMTLAAALFASFQILLIGRVTRSIDKPLLFNGVQSLWGALVCAPIAFWPGAVAATPTQIWHWPLVAQLSLLCLGFGSTVIAFALQLRAQARLSPTVASLLFLLESPIALVFAMLLLGERLTASEVVGAILIFTSAVAAVVR